MCQFSSYTKLYIGVKHLSGQITNAIVIYVHFIDKQTAVVWRKPPVLGVALDYNLI